MIDIGIGHYRIKSENEIDAIWYSSRLDKKKIGKGIAIGDTSNGFPGEYKITYFDPDGNNTGTFDLKIIKSGLVHELYWSLDGEVLFVGVGIETSLELTAGGSVAPIPSLKLGGPSTQPLYSSKRILNK